MPHLMVEISAGLAVDETKLLADLAQALYDSGEFVLSDIKSRLYRADASLVGTGGGSQDFIAVRLLLLAGRTDAVKQALAQAVLAVLGGLPFDCKPQYSVEVVELSPLYWKA
ncbi:5-carboxymethyl-2-hydroxymuconate Delta-isomerase [Neisseria leonii]|uniref:5-carboxymethyl-2-hydroxymuconate Delta-isomerase n=1 Tax=Neisseria leonii TaxID=2995413 RepID=UPI00237A1FBB|nr:5-carboxymethyl-2-hydroxymuconate Delta-isomerase [Neisseria sp. 3986]MDD9326074.1 5-carboxymethyl-2-hydroxymuconate Delta-isomerase [Neisseria sp. 3986]